MTNIFDISLDIHSHADSAWLAGRDNNNEGTWEWYDGLTDTYRQFTYTHWGNNEPDSGKKKKSCTVNIKNILL
jgi:hypothetical protein